MHLLRRVPYFLCREMHHPQCVVVCGLGVHNVKIQGLLLCRANEGVLPFGLLGPGHGWGLESCWVRLDEQADLGKGRYTSWGGLDSRDTWLMVMYKDIVYKNKLLRKVPKSWSDSILLNHLHLDRLSSFIASGWNPNQLDFFYVAALNGHK
jgi:hypothetical protein